MTTFPDFVNVDYFSDIGRTVAQTDVPSEARAAIDAVGAQPPAGTPTAVACFIFDDCPVEDYTAVKPILDGKGVKGGFAFPSNYPGSNAQYMSWANVQALQAAGHEILSHSLNHGHLDTFADPDMSLETTIDNINNRAAYEAHGITVRGHAYTFGEHNATIRRLVREYYEYAFATNNGSGSQSPLSTYAIRRIAIKDSTVTATHYAQIDTAITNGELIAFIIHANPTAAEFTSGGGGHTRLADVIQYCLDNDVPVVTPGEAFDRCRNILDAGDYPGGASYSVISREGRGYVPGAGDTHVLSHSSDALTKAPSAFNEGITYQLYQSSSGAPGGGPGTVQTVIVDLTGTVGGLNYQMYFRNGNNGMWLRHGSTDNSSWTSWIQVAAVHELTGSTAAIGTLPSAYAQGVTIQNVLSTASPVTPRADNGPGVLRTVITVPGSSGITTGQLNFQEFIGTSGNGVWVRNALSDNSAWLTPWKRVDVEGGLAPVIHAATAKTTPVSDDEFALVDSAASNALKHIKYSDLLAAISASVSAGTDADALTSGESTLSRRAIMNGATLTSGIVRLTYFTAKKTETINSVRIGTYTTAAGATPTLCRVGIYSVDGSGNLTLVASTENDTSLFASASTTYTKALSAAWSKVAGTRYAVGVLVVTGATAPTIQGQILSIGDELGQAPRLSGARSGQSDLPSSITVGNVADTAHQCYVAMVP